MHLVVSFPLCIRQTTTMIRVERGHIPPPHCCYIILIDRFWSFSLWMNANTSGINFTGTSARYSSKDSLLCADQGCGILPQIWASLRWYLIKMTVKSYPTSASSKDLSSWELTVRIIDFDCQLFIFWQSFLIFLLSFLTVRINLGKSQPISDGEKRWLRLSTQPPLI